MNRWRWRVAVSGWLLALAGGCGGGGGQRLTDVDVHEDQHRHSCARFSTPSEDVAAPPLVQGTVVAFALDDAGNRYVAGQFCGTRDFHPGAGVDDRTAFSTDVFVTRFNADSSYAWTAAFGGSRDDGATALAVVGHTVYVGGDFASTDFRVGQAVVAARGFDAFLVSLDLTNGEPRKDFGQGGVVTFGGSGQDFCEALAAAGNSLFMTGSFDSLDAGAGGLGGTSSRGRLDGFVLALDRVTGEPLSGFGTTGVASFGGTRSDQAFDVAVNASTLYVAGTFWSGDFGIGAPGSVHSQRLYDAFVVALDAATGQPRSSFGAGGVQTFGGFGQDVAEALAVAGSVLYVGGRFGSNNAGVGGLGAFAPANDSHDAFVLALDAATGTLLTSFGAGGLEVFGGFGVPRRGFDVEGVTCLTLAGDRLCAGGFLRAKDAGVGAPGPIDSRGFADAFAWVMNAGTGNPLLDFGSGGVQTFGGSGNELVASIAARGTDLILAGSSDSVDAFADDCGPFDAHDWGGFLLTLDSGDGGPICPDTYPD